MINVSGTMKQIKRNKNGKVVLPKSSALKPCQKSISISSKSLMSLYKYINNEIGLPYKLTSRLNQDYLENFFSRIICIGRNHSHPNAVKAIDFRILVISGTEKIVV
uniref:Uncharacterized protein n=1 Tax=Lepeophtheirus salmonis TaxID=72036 RepID=A0A0K2V6J8_LEPSM